MRLIGGTPVHRIDHVAPIHHDKRSNPPSDPSGPGTRDSRDAGAPGLHRLPLGRHGRPSTGRRSHSGGAGV